MVLVLSWSVVAQHIWATRSHFKSERMAQGALFLAILVICTTLIYSALLILRLPPAVPMIVGFGVELASLALFWSAIITSRQARLRFAFDPALPHGLLDVGPYRYIRHPFYASYVLFWIGWAMAIWSIWTLPFLAGVIGFYIAAATGEERRFASSPLNADYSRYRQGAGLFWPKLNFKRLRG